MKKVNKEDIKTINEYISLNPGDCIIDSSGTIEEVSYIDYVAKMVVAMPIECETVIGDLSSRSRATIITFDTIVSDYQKVLEDTDAIKTTNGDISIKAGDSIINNGRLLEVIDVAYDSGLVDVNEYGDEYTISLADIDAVDYIDSVTQIVTTNPRKNRLIIISNGIKPQSCDEENKDEYVAAANSSPKVGDFIVDSDGNKYKVYKVDYGNLFIVAISKDGEQHTIHFDEFSSGEYSKVLNSSVKGHKDDYTAVVDSLLRVGNEIIDANGDRYNVTMVDYNNSSIVAVSEDGEELSFSFYGFACSDYKKVLK